MSNTMNGMPGMPGAGNMGDTLEFIRNFWGGMKVPGMTMPSMSPDEINKQITDLKAVESWLQMNMSMLRSTIQTLEVQSATLTALQSMSDNFSKAANPKSGDDKPAFESPFFKSAEAAAQDGAPDSAPDTAAFAAQFANPAAWWNTVQDQFTQAVNTAMTPPKKPARKKASTAKKRTTTSKKTASKN